MTVTLRPAGPADLDAITEVMLACWRESYATVLPERAIATMTPELVERLWTRALTGTAPGAAIVAVSEAGAVLGVTRYELGPDHGGIVQSLYVSPRAQRLGIGARLLSAAVAGLRDLDAPRFHLWVFADNAPSIAFYQRQGWVLDGTSRVQAGFDVEELRLEYAGSDPDPGRSSALRRTASDIVASGPDAPAGVSIGLRTAGGEFTAVTGNRSLGDTAEPMTLSTHHDLASITKILATTTALIALVSAAHVHLDDPVARYLPGFTGDGKETVTIRQLLTHRGGLWEWQPLYLNGRTGETAIRYVEQLPLRYRPDTARHYSDLGFILLGRVIAAITGVRLDEAVKHLVTKPLGLDATGYRTATSPAIADIAVSAPGDVTEQRMVATGVPYPVLESDARFGGWRSRPIAGEVNDGNAFHAFGGVSGHAGLFSTLGDLLDYAWALAHYRDHDSLWNPRVVETFLTDGPDAEQALGFRRYRFTADGKTTTMYGHPGFVGCVVGFSPDAGVALALCSNRLARTDNPVPNDELWSLARTAANTQLTGLDPKARR
ncbi:GNAT family N-acetyltransferase [Stackebrandtia nassauensis]|uniref:Beta-lactamase n=1 Tax=Stackebrandtia nassauensis (strain DSM 44728 / CIP 108903 / NRRL B-16338 / NBRC 102104 / LLR-40K-21) TaxID=446470 RepID=D3PVR1_STANL|nr:GNAT family N-acetyltransferase [Stackebrandtia nassauensis]ADD43175.1 beta-lactamase [Stackebrandtia nassauensis DSM 44728]